MKSRIMHGIFVYLLIVVTHMKVTAAEIETTQYEDKDLTTGSNPKYIKVTLLNRNQLGHPYWNKSLKGEIGRRLVGSEGNEEELRRIQPKLESTSEVVPKKRKTKTTEPSFFNFLGEDEEEDNDASDEYEDDDRDDYEYEKGEDDDDEYSEESNYYSGSDKKPSDAFNYPDFRRVKKYVKVHRYIFPLLIAYKLKFFTMVPLLVGALVLLVGTTGLAGFFFALFSAAMGLNPKTHHH